METRIGSCYKLHVYCIIYLNISYYISLHVISAAVCKDKRGNMYSEGEVWHPNKLQKCTCSQGNVTCERITGCWDRLGKPHVALDVWLLDDRQTVCRCSVDGKTTCKKHPVQVCLDDKKIVRSLGSRWFMSNCTNCTCQDNGLISCTQRDIQAHYGRFVIKKKSCYLGAQPGCVTANETTRDCNGIYLI